jgi:hypothetical protein
MKKGLLGLLVIALTVVGCQNYDDQFDDLNSKISSLATTVDGLLSVQTSVSALSTKLDNLASTALTDSDLTDILTEVTTVKAAVAALETTDVSGIEAEVADLDTEVKSIIEKLNELLTANAVINQNVRITSLAELSLAEDLISTGAEDPNVTINGSFVVNTTGTSDIEAAADVARLNAVLAKVKVVMKTATITTDEALNPSSLQYVQGDLYVITSGTGTLADAAVPNNTLGALTTITGALAITQGGDLLMPTLNSVAGGITVNTTGVTITSVDMSNLTEGAVITEAGKILLPDALSVKISSVLPAVVNVASATTFESSSQAAQAATTITVDGSDSFILKSTTFSGAVVITATGAINLADVTTAKALTLTSGAGINLGGLTKVDENTVLVGTDVQMGSLATITGATSLTTAFNVSATTVGIGSLASSKGVVTLTGPSTVIVNTLATLDGTFTAGDATTFSAEALSTTSGTITPKSGATVHLKSLNDPAKLTTLGNVVNLKLVEQSGVASLVTAVEMVSLDYTGKKATTVAPGSQETMNSLTILAANASLTTLNVAGHLGTLTVDNSTLTSLATAIGSVIIKTDIKNNTKLGSFSLGHTFLSGDNALTISVTGNTDDAFVSLDMSSMQKVKHVNITGNTSLTTIMAPGATTLAEPLAVVTLTLDSNLVGGTWTDAVPGSETTTHTLATLTGATATGFKALYDAYKGQSNRVAGTVTMSIEIDAATTKMAADGVAQSAGPYQQLIGNDGKINDEAEHALLP